MSLTPTLPDQLGACAGSAPGCGRRGCCLVCLALLAPGARAQGQPWQIRTTGQEANTLKFDPANLKAPGFSVELMRELQRANPDLRFVGQEVLRPVKRIDLELESGVLDVFFGLVRTDARESRLQVFDTLYTQAAQLAVRASDPVAVQTLEDIRALGLDGSIGVPKGSAYADMLRAEGGLLLDDGVASVTATLRKLITGRVRFVFFSDALLRKYIQDEGLEQKIRLLPARFSTQEVCLVASRQAPPEMVARLRAALERLRASGELRRLQDKYQVRP